MWSEQNPPHHAHASTGLPHITSPWKRSSSRHHTDQADGTSLIPYPTLYYEHPICIHSLHATPTKNQKPSGYNQQRNQNIIRHTFILYTQPLLAQTPISRTS